MKTTALLSATLLLSACATLPAPVPPQPAEPAKPSVPYPSLDMQAQIDSLGIQVARLENQLESLHTRIQQLERQNTAPRTAAPAPRRPPVAGSVEALPAATPDTDSAEQRYQQAQQQYRSGNYAAAITLLRHAESGGNGGDTARQSMYLLLQSHQRLANCESVINIGNRYANRFRSSAQAPEALYSVAQCQTRLQQRDIARDTWRRLIQIYPDSAAAKRAYRQMNPR